jgi:hypothetical protein
MLLFFLVVVYPLIQSLQCIRVWNKSLKADFQHWCIFWILYILLWYIHAILTWFWIIENFSFLIEMTFSLFLIFNYHPKISKTSRKYILLPLLQDSKRYIRYLPIEQAMNYFKILFNKGISMFIT